MKKKIDVVTRSFQGGAGTGTEDKPFNMKQFEEKVARPILNLLRFPEVVGTIIAVTNGEIGNKLAEKIDKDGKTPTTRAFEEIFPAEMKSGKILVPICTSWGQNPGSGTALNEGIALVQSFKVMCWSPEIEMDGYRITSALDFAEARNLSVVGFLRKLYWERTQWNVVQNTACIWDTATIKSIGGFAAECNGTGETVNTAEFGEVPLAGMEDFHAMLRLMQKYGENFRWGLVGRTNTLKWDTDFEPGSERESNHLKKVARQYLVMQAYVRKIFPDKKLEDVLEKFFSYRQQD